jgi:arginyl-tRNA synthetase
MNALAALNEARRQEIISLRDTVRLRYSAQPFPAAAEYPLAVFRDRTSAALREEFGRDDLVWESDLLDRSRFHADVALRIPALLRESGAKEYITAQAPRIARALRSPMLAGIVGDVTQKGIYVNVRLTDAWFLAGVAMMAERGEQFGLNDTRASRTEVVDYSSPNVAKVLHAGHLRSTIIGHVLGNLYEACGALVYRVNHINDFGGFGFMLEGYRRFEPFFPADMTPNERSVTIYSIRRALERAVGASADLASLPEPDRELISVYFPGAATAKELLAAYDEYRDASEARFARLEEGDLAEVSLWEQIVERSLDSFQSFYSGLGIQIDFTIGESFYLDAGIRVLERAVAQGRAYELTQEIVDAQIADLDRAVASGEMTPEARDAAAAALVKDLGALVVPLPDGERLVALRSDGRSIYATRDLGAIQVRREVFDPTDINYVVGQEQRVHFSRLFQAAEVLGLLTPDEVQLKHTYFGFYVDAATGKKLSSRDSVAGVNELLAESVAYYRVKTAANGGMTEEEVEDAARQLALGAVIFNDLKSDMKGTVSIARGELAPTIAAFEKSGGVYVVYAACRARAILRRYNRPLPRAADIAAFDVSDQESLLILRLLEFPEKVARAADEDNPAILVRHLLDMAGIYNSYYAAAPVLHEGGANEFRLLITKAVQDVLIGGLKLLHIECPPKI